MEGISSFSLPELTLPHFDGSGWNFPQAALTGGGTTRTTNLGGVYITVNGYNARNDDELAQTVADKINGMIHEDSTRMIQCSSKLSYNPIYKMLW